MSSALSHPDEGQQFDRKSLRVLSKDHGDFPGLAQDCVAFANSIGGTIVLGIEDDEVDPPPTQRVHPSDIDRLRKRIGELTVNVDALPELVRHPNGGEYIVVKVPRSVGVASTSTGRFYLRVADESKPVLGDDVLRLANERPSIPWEALTTLGAKRSAADLAKTKVLLARVRASERVSQFVREKSDLNILEHYALVSGKLLTNLGVLMIGARADRAQLASAPVIQVIKYDDRGLKVHKLVWDDFTFTPIELVDEVWDAVPDFRESYELPAGMFRTSVPAFEKDVIRELLVNALVHKPYTQRGDIFLNLRPDRLEVVNPGRLPLGVTPRNVLHASRRRNDGLARIFHDLGLMEREGSGFDLMYERLLATGRAAPQVTEGADSVHVSVPRRVVQPQVVRLIAEADSQYQLGQRERIALGTLAHSESMSAGEFAARLELDDPNALREWVARMIDLGLVERTGRTKATRYFIPPRLLRSAGIERRTTLSRVQPHRLRALIVEDLERFPDSSSSEIHKRVGPEISLKTLKRALDTLIDEGSVAGSGQHRWRRYRLSSRTGAA